MKTKPLVALFFGISLFAIARANAEATVDRVILFKKQRLLQLRDHNHVVREYRVALGSSPIGPKRQQGDYKTPEGHYRIDGRNPQSQFHKSLHISYPNDVDRELAREAGVSPGGDIFLHGLPNGQGAIGARHRERDWTWGCIAVTNEEIEEIWKLVKNNTPIDIKP